MAVKMQMIGRRFGKFTVIEETKNENSKSKNKFYKCECACGNTETIVGTRLRNGIKIQCVKCVTYEKGYNHLKEMIGQKFGRLTVIDVIYDIDEKDLNKRSKCICQCDCGSDPVIVTKNNLTQNNTKSCGCYASELAHERFSKDYTNMISKHGIKILERSDQKRKDGGAWLWWCECPVCKNKFLAVPHAILNTNTTSCGCAYNKRDVTGETFGDLTVIKKVKRPEIKNQHTIYWECKCKWGNTRVTTTHELISGNATSCLECNKYYEKAKILGQRFGRLVVTGVDWNIDDNETVTYCTCKCDCGRTTRVLRSSLITGNTSSCGHHKYTKDWTGYISKYYVEFLKRSDKQTSDGSFYWWCKCPHCEKEFLAIPAAINREIYPIVSCGCYSTKSKRELFIENILKEKNVKYKHQYDFDDCRDKALLKFDFALLDDNDEAIYIIEYDGEHHFFPIDLWGGEKSFQGVQRRDNIKNEYCSNHSIPMLRIPYWHSDDEIRTIILNLIKEVDSWGK